MILSYARVSLPEQAREGTTSIDTQLQKNRAIASILGLSSDKVIEFVDAGVSGAMALAHRPNGKDMLETARKGDVIVANKLDRLFRSASDALVTAETCQRRGVDIILIDMGVEPITANGTSKLFFSMLAAFAEFERGRIAERMDDGRKAKRARGGYMGGKGPSYGYRVEGRGRFAVIVEDEAEQATIRRVDALRRQGFNAWEIGGKLQREGILSRTGKRFQIPQILRMIEQMRGRRKVA